MESIASFALYGFPESHAVSFAKLVYISSWIKLHYPDVFCAALLNSQPMGFYAPHTIVEDAKRHGVEVRGVDVARSAWESTLEGPEAGRPVRAGEAPVLRVGLGSIRGLPREVGEAVVAARRAGPFEPVRPMPRMSWSVTLSTFA